MGGGSRGSRGRVLALRALAITALAAVGSFIAFLNVRHGRVVLPYSDRVPGGDFTGHLGLALLLSLAVNVGLSDARLFGRRIGPRAITVTLIGALALEEFSQRYVPGRQVQLQDVVASLLGVLLGGLIVSAWSRRRAERRGRTV